MAGGSPGRLSPTVRSEEDEEDGPELEVGLLCIAHSATAAAAAACCALRSGTALPLAALPRTRVQPSPSPAQVFSEDEELARDTTEVQLAAGRDPQGIPWELTQFTRDGYRVRNCRCGVAAALGGRRSSRSSVAGRLR